MRLLWNGKEVDCISADIRETLKGDLACDAKKVVNAGMDRQAEFLFSPACASDLIGSVIDYRVRIERSPDSPGCAFLPANPGFWTAWVSDIAYSLSGVSIFLEGIQVVLPDAS
jgi:hypothetical protein